MKIKATKFLEDRGIEDNELDAVSTDLRGKVVEYKYLLSNLLDYYAELNIERHEKSRFLIDVRKPQFKWFIVFILFSFIGMAHTMFQVAILILSLF